ncbi:hypothetical protein Gpo141_00013964 [Globisporangium polare]
MVSVKAPLVLVAAALAAPSISPVAGAYQPRLHPNVHRTPRAQGVVNLIVSLKDSTESVLQSVGEAELATRGAKITHIIERLEAHASKSQAPPNELLSDTSSLEATTSTGANSSTPLFKSKESFWISNLVDFEAATFELVEKLATLESVADVREEEVSPRSASITSRAVDMSTTDEAAGSLAERWGITKVGAPDVWAEGYTGQRVVVG